MTGLSVSEKGTDEAIRQNDEIIHELFEGAQQELEELGQKIVSDMVDTLQNESHIVTGNLIAHSKVFEVGEHKITVGNDAEYVEYVEYGRGPVAAAPGKTLHWVDKYTGEDVFAKSASATNPSPFVEPAVITNTEQFDNIITRRIDERIG